METCNTARAPGGKSQIWRYAAYLLIVVLCVTHVQQVIVLSGGERIPGDLGDSRFNNLILEHLWKTLHGDASLASPAMFYPLKDTLYMSDTHYGTFPFYAIFRTIGWSPETALQGWALAISALNSISLIFIFNRLRIPMLATAALTFVGTAHFAFAINTVHLQLLPLYPAILAFYFMLRLLQSGKYWYLFGILTCWIYQHLCTPYYGYFLTILLMFAFFSITIFGRNSDAFRTMLKAMRLHSTRIAIAVVAALVLVGMFYWPYFQISRQTGTRGLEEVIQLSPSLQAWFTAAGTSIWYSAINNLPSDAPGIELSLFPGFFLILLSSASIIICARLRKNNACALFGIGIFSALLLMALFVTKWPLVNASLHNYLSMAFNGVRAFRAIGRFIYLGLPLTAIGLACTLLCLRDHILPRRLSAISSVVLVILAIESLSGATYSYSKSEAQERTLAVAEAIKRQGDHRPVVAFAPGSLSQPAWITNIDGICGAWSLGLATLNGYSGHIPSGHAVFFSSLEPSAARESAKKNGVASSALSIVSHYPEWFSEKYKLAKFNLNKPFITLKPVGSVLDISTNPGAEVMHHVELCNESEFLAHCERLNLNLSYKIYDAEGKEVLDPPTSRTVIAELQPHIPEIRNLSLLMPAKPGNYRVHVSMVHEGVAWWSDLAQHGYDLFVQIR